MDEPLYVLPQNKARAILPKVITLFVLGIIFYLGILLNLALLELRAAEETTVKVTSLVILLVIIIIGIIIAVKRANTSYLFFRTNLSWSSKSLVYTSIVNTTPNSDLIDKIFKTYNINLGEGLIIRNIPLTVPIQNYLQQMIDYAKRSGLSQATPSPATGSMAPR